MPSAPPKVCSCQGCSACAGRCPNLTPGGRCPDCTVIANRGWRNPDHKRIYNSARWRALRRQVLREQPFCATDGCRALSHDVHHIVDLADNLSLAYVRTNVEGLCHPHHSAHTARTVLHRD